MIPEILLFPLVATRRDYLSPFGCAAFGKRAFRVCNCKGAAGGTSVRSQLSWFLLADFEATPASSCELGRPWPAARLVGPCVDGELSACRSVVCSPRDVTDRDDS